MGKCPMCQYDPDEVYQSWTLEFKGRVPSQNTLKANTRYAHGYRQWRKLFQKQLEDQLKKVPKAEGYRIGIFTRGIGARCRAYDLENLIGGLKPLIDVLKKNGVIVDDSPRHWRGHYRQQKSTDGINRLTIELRQVVDIPQADK